MMLTMDLSMDQAEGLLTLVEAALRLDPEREDLLALRALVLDTLTR